MGLTIKLLKNSAFALLVFSILGGNIIYSVLLIFLYSMMESVDDVEKRK